MNKLLKCFIILCSLLMVTICRADEPLTTDNRVKTYVYNENEIYPLVIFYGYQTSIEFAHGEEVVTISMGDSYAWQMTPVGRRIFVKPLEENMHTNMTIITNKRAYQFDLFSKKSDGEFNNDLVYVMRFFYPENNKTDLSSGDRINLGD